MGMFDNIKRKHEEKQKVAALEETKHQKLVAGELTPITVSTSLRSGEEAYLELTARRMATFDSTVQETVATGKKRHVVRRTVVGGVLGGGIGAIAGAATAGSKQTSITTDKTIYETKLVDSGDLVFTNKRIIFTGNDGSISIPYDQIAATSLSGNQFKVKYPDMLTDEFYEVFGSAAKDVQLYYNQITQGQA